MEDRSCWAVVCVMNTHVRQKLLGIGEPGGVFG